MPSRTAHAIMRVISAEKDRASGPA
jgi:hypothetical protein